LQEPSEILVLALAPSFVQHAAHEFTGAGLLELRNQRVERAKHLLSDPRRKIAAVSDALGFPHQSHFTATFHTVVGITPGAYRRQRGGE
jgi:AraC-like DNA-binding protein